MKKNRREGDAFNIAFLDIITCGFGAIILLLMIAKPGDPPEPESLTPPAGVIKDLQRQLFKVRSESELLDRQLSGKQQRLSPHTLIWDIGALRRCLNTAPAKSPISTSAISSRPSRARI